ncbi:ABC transporter ATP-binding protein [uncultured Corynebacterium sp.]|uniref:ABC transporter ATP-binding protein n=1 Tax=uncultured Corynebacterium sp. TaxID=159447 RepID=UPI0025EC43D4|nr:ATP-binding cassette domain-containing protein [uncultured Corynebacterium sp.]
MKAPDIRDILVAPRTRRGLAAAGVTVRKSGRTLLDDVTVDAAPGRVTALVGPNGAGKSTLLAALAGDEAPAAGSVIWGDAPSGDVDLATMPIRDRARVRAVLPQSHPATVPFTAGEVIEFGRAPWGEPDPALRARVIGDCDVAHLLDRPVTVLSGGELARVHCARVLMQDTPVLLLDEPTAALDLRHAEAILDLASGRASAGATVVVVLHDLAAAAAHADDVVVLDGGRVVAAGDPAEILTADLIGEVYGLDVEVLADSRGNPVIVPARGEGHRRR